MMDLFRRHSSHTTSIIFRSCDIELDNNGSGGTCGHHCCSGLSGFPISYLHDHVSLLVFSLANPDELLSNVMVDETEMTMRDASPLGTEQD
jgi:hypothetical protein